MANEKNIKDSIAVLKRVRDRCGNFSLLRWQNACQISEVVKSEENLHTCGMAACIGGYIAVSPEFHAVGGSVDSVGAPCLRGDAGMHALKIYWDVCVEEVRKRCDNNRYTLNYYGVDSIDDITIDMAIEAVESLLKLEG